MSSRMLLLCATLACTTAAQASVPPQAAAEIDKINRDWGTAIVKGDAETIAAAYGPDAVFCTRDGKCFSGYDAILALTKAALAKTGPMTSAAAHTSHREEDHGYIYEWGQATETTAKGEIRAGGYFTIWKQQPDGHWKIFRNIVLP